MKKKSQPDQVSVTVGHDAAAGRVLMQYNVALQWHTMPAAEAVRLGMMLIDHGMLAAGVFTLPGTVVAENPKSRPS